MACSNWARCTAMSVACTRVGLELRLGLRDVGLRRCAALEAIGREPQRRREGLHRLVEELLLGVGGPKLEVVEGQLGLQAEPRGLEIGGGRLRPRARRRDRPADPAPQVDLVRHVEREEQVAAAARVQAPDGRNGWLRTRGRS